MLVFSKSLFELITCGSSYIRCYQTPNVQRVLTRIYCGLSCLVQGRCTVEYLEQQRLRHTLGMILAMRHVEVGGERPLTSAKADVINLKEKTKTSRKLPRDSPKIRKYLPKNTTPRASDSILISISHKPTQNPLGNGQDRRNVVASSELFSRSALYGMKDCRRCYLLVIKDDTK